MWDRVEQVEIFLVIVSTVLVREEPDGGVVLTYEDQSHSPTLTWQRLTASQPRSLSTDDKQKTGRQNFIFIYKN